VAFIIIVFNTVVLSDNIRVKWVALLRGFWAGFRNVGLLFAASV